MIKKRRGISPVIAVVILIAVAVALGIAVAFWATGLIGTLGKVEKLEIRTAYATTNSTYWTITMNGANTGTADITIVEVTINGQPYDSIGSGDVTINQSLSYSIPTGSSFSIKIYISHSSSHFTSGQTIDVALVSGSGTAFKRTVVLP